MPYISIQATDTLFFRDGRPFSMGEESFAQGIFPPPPSVLHGALRSAFMSQNMGEDYSIKTGIEESAKLRLHFIALQRHIAGQAGGSIWLPMPADLLVPDDGGKDQGFPLQLIPKPVYSNALSRPKLLTVNTDSNEESEQVSKELKYLPEVLTTDRDGKAMDGTHLIRKNTLDQYLSGQGNSFEVQALSAFLIKESKIGIGRNQDAGTVREGQLFRVQTNRPAIVHGDNVEKLRILLGFEQLELAESGWLSLGGERRVAHFEQEEVFQVTQPEIDAKRFKIYLATPAIFADGWQPKKLFYDLGLRLISAALGRSQPIGGWDLEKRGPKPMLQTVSAGSVYFVEAGDPEKANAAAKAIRDKKSIADSLNGTDYAAQGFGIAYVGRVNINQ